MIPHLGGFLDGTGRDWEDDAGRRSLVQRLALDYYGVAEYRGGPGTDRRGRLLRGWEAATGGGQPERLERLIERVKYWAPLAVDLFGYSRGGDDCIRLCPLLAALGAPVRVLCLFDPVPARGWHALLRVIPFAPLRHRYPRPDVGVIVQVLAGQEHRRLFRHAAVDVDHSRGDVELLVRGRHGATQGELPEAFARWATNRAGVRWRKKSPGWEGPGAVSSETAENLQRYGTLV